MSGASFSFREWLIERLQASDAMRLQLPDEKLDALAATLGVQTDVLIEARVRFKIRKAQYGLQLPIGPKAAGTRHVQIEAQMPDEVYEAWKQELASRGAKGSGLLRSVVHAYLLGAHEPPKLLKSWLWRGRTLPVTHDGDRGRERKPACERALITTGAKRALRLRAQKRGSTTAGIVRALVLDILDGNWHGVQLVDAEMMYDDETRYFLGS